MKLSILAVAAAVSLLAAGAALAQGNQGQTDQGQGSGQGSGMGGQGMGGQGMGGQGMGRGNPAMRAVREACAADMQKFCADKQGPDRRQCMADHGADLSDGCKSAIATARQQMQAEHPPQ